MTAPALTATHVLGGKLDSIPFSAYHLLLIVVLGTVGFVEGYDLALGGSLIVLAKEPLHLSQLDIRWLIAGPTFVVVIGGFIASALSDRVSRKLVMQIGVIISTGFTLLIPLAQTAEQLVIIRLITGIGLGFAIPAAFPIAAELMPAHHRRTYGAIYEVMLASAFTLLPFVAFILAGNPIGFRLIALPGGLALGVVPLLVHFAIPESPRWHLLKDQRQVAVDAVNLMIRRCGSRVAPLTVAELGANFGMAREKIPSFMALFGRGQLRWTVIGILSGVSASCAYYTCAILLPKALVDQGGAVALSFGLSSVLFMASIPGKLFTGYLMEIIGRRWTITYSLAGSLPGIGLMAAAHWAGSAAAVCLHCRCADHRLHGAVGVSMHAGLSLRAISHRAARAWSLLRRIQRAADLGRGVPAVPGTLYGFTRGVLRHAAGGGCDWCLCAASVRPRDRRPIGNRHGTRGFSGGLKPPRQDAMGGVPCQCQRLQVRHAALYPIRFNEDVARQARVSTWERQSSARAGHVALLCRHGDLHAW